MQSEACFDGELPRKSPSKAIERRLLGLALASVMKAQIIDFNLRALMGIATLF